MDLRFPVSHDLSFVSCVGAIGRDQTSLPGGKNVT